MAELTPTSAGLAWLPPPSAEVVVTIRRNTLIAIVCSIILHLVMLVTLKQQPLKQGSEAPLADTPFTVNLAPPKQAKAQIATPAAPQPTPLPPTPQVHHQQALPPRHVPSTPRLTPPPVPQPAPTQVPPTPAVPPTLPPDAPQATDMASYMAAVRARKEAEARAAAGYAPEAPTADQAREAAIQRNLHSGTQGMFQILARTSHSVRFVFRYRSNAFSNQREETHEVDVSQGGDLPRAVVEKLTELIQKYYSGSFEWISDRRSKPVSLSARPQDTATLEDFLLRELPELSQEAPPPHPARRY